MRPRTPASMLARRSPACLPGAAGRRPDHSAAGQVAAGPAPDRGFPISAPSGEADPDFYEELTRIRDTPAETAHADIAVALGRPVPDRLKRPDLPQRAADLLGWVWRETVLPYWKSRRQILEADVVARTRQLSQGGWAAALDDIRPGTRWLGGGRLRISADDDPSREISGAELLFVPVTPRLGWASWAEPHRYALIYPCSGVLAGPDLSPATGALARLLGPGRAGVLLRLDTPKSTTQLVALTGQRLGSVGRHLRILLEPGSSSATGPAARSSITGPPPETPWCTPRTQRAAPSGRCRGPGPGRSGWPGC